jgi:hypothetical protein
MGRRTKAETAKKEIDHHHQGFRNVAEAVRRALALLCDR